MFLFDNSSNLVTKPRRVNFFGDTLNWINFGGCVIVFCGVILYKIIFHLEKEEAKAKAAVGMVESDDVVETDGGGGDKRERQPLKHAKDDDDRVSEDDDDLEARTTSSDSESDNNNQAIEMRLSMNGQHDGIEMRRSVARNRSGASHSDIDDNMEDSPTSKLSKLVVV